jgi:multidrug efflux system membrane fusion protein
MDDQVIDEQVGRPETITKPVSRDTRRGGRLRPVIILIVLLLIGVGAWRLIAMLHPAGRPARQAAQEQPVGAASITQGSMRVMLTGLGTVTPLATITVQTQINGQLMSVGFKEGQMVQKGDFLAQIDPRPYQAALDQAQGALVHDQGLLAQAQSDLARYETLKKQDSIAMQQVADQQFLVKQDQGTVLEDQATIETDKLNLVYCHIVSPVTGRVGLRLVDPGNYVQTTSTMGLVVVTQTQPISVIFVLPEDEIPAVAQAFRAGKTLPVTVFNRTNAKAIATGTLDSIDNEVDTTTGTVKLRALFPNADEALFPNQFVNAQLVVQTLDGVTIAPTAAVQEGAPGSFVYLIKPGGTVAVQVVKTGVTDGDQVQILSGLKPGDQVVVDGADRLRDGAKVRITPDQADPAANVVPAATVNGGPGAPPGEQPSNATPVPPAERAGPRGHRHNQEQGQQNGGHPAQPGSAP